MQYLQILNPWMSEEAGRVDVPRLTLPCRIISSRRKSLSMQVEEDGSIILRIPMGMTAEAAKAFAMKHEKWLGSHYKKIMDNQASRRTYTPGEIREYKDRLRPVLEHRAAYYAGLLGVDFARITIREQKTRWGSCSARGNLSFNWKLALMPPEILDYVVAHEVAHRVELNHSPRFWALVEQLVPDYRTRRRWLKENGGKQ